MVNGFTKFKESFGSMLKKQDIKQESFLQK